MLNNKLISDAIHNSEKFKKCSPTEKLLALIYGIVGNGEINKKNLEIWNKDESKYKNEITFDTKAYALRYIVCSSNASRNLRALIDYGIFRFCMEEYLPIKRLARRDLRDISKHISISENNPEIRIGILLFPFGYDVAKNFLDRANFTDVDNEKILFAIKKLDEYLMIKVPHLLKDFIHSNGPDNFNFINSFSEEIIKVIDIPEYKHRSKTFLLNEIDRRNEPVFISDLDLDLDEISSIIADDEKKELLLEDLIRYIHRYPGDNVNSKLVKILSGMAKSRIYRFCINNSIFKIK